MSRWSIIDSTLEGRQAAYFPHWSRGLCPTDPAANALYRQKLRTTSDPGERAAIKKRCKEDFLYYLTSFVYIFLAKGDPKPVPFIPYDFQVETLTMMWKCLHDGQEDCRLVKPRDMGVSWMVMSLFEHGWHFMRDVQFLIGSRREDEIDGTSRDASGASPVGEWSKLLPKVDFIHLHQPSWLLPMGYVPRVEPFRTRLRIVNPELGGLITGESANPKFGRSSRFYAIGFDEHAHTEHAFQIIGACSQTSDCHFWWSSPDGPGTAHAMLGRAPIKQVRLDWWMHPLHAAGMTIDPTKGDRSRTSPWLEKELARIGYDAVLANNEIWADETRSGGAYYAGELFDLLLGVGDRMGTVRERSHVGEIDFRVDADGPRPIGWVEQPGGKWKLWLHFDVEGRPPCDERYIMGIDAAAGSTDEQGRGASNSAIVVLGEISRSKVAEYATHGLAAHKFAATVLAAARWFCGSEEHAYMIWDAGSAGSSMGAVIVDDYDIRSNIYRRKTGEGKVNPGYIKSKNPQESLAPWGSHEKMLWEGGYLERSVDCVGEMRHYHHNPTGGAPIHAASRQTEDPSGARENHGDRTTATVLACMELANRRANPKKKEEEPPFGSYLHMQQLQKRQARRTILI